MCSKLPLLAFGRRDELSFETFAFAKITSLGAILNFTMSGKELPALGGVNRIFSRYSVENRIYGELSEVDGKV